MERGLDSSSLSAPQNDSKERESIPQIEV